MLNLDNGPVIQNNQFKNYKKGNQRKLKIEETNSKIE